MNDLNHIYSDQLEKPFCPLCGHHRHKITNEFPPYSVVNCSECSLSFLYPRLSEEVILKFYKKGYFNHDDDGGYSSYENQKDSLKATFKRFLENLQKNNFTGGSLLEIGCGYGYLLEEAEPFFDLRTGTDLSQEAVNQAKKSADKIYLGGIEQLPKESRFDYIIANQVIEHIYNPIKFTQKLVQHLNPNGTIIFSTPDIGSFWKTLQGNHWSSFKVPEHVCFYNENSLTSLLHKAELTDLKVIPYPHAFPIELVLSKLKIKLPFKIQKNIWIPKTTIAVAGRKI